MNAPDAAPLFIVVGPVNRGKSSIVATLAADESVRIDATPGTTRRKRSFPMRLDGRTLYELIDTPGFERARHVLAWLRARETSTADRQALVQRFIEEHAGGNEFEQERELLEPILNGGAILYVVDGSVPFSPAHEAEMEILRWTAQPRMALINPIGPDDYTDAWRPVLDQYFSLVRVFNAHRADFAARIALLRTLRELSDRWRPAIDHAIAALVDDRRLARKESASTIAEMLADMLTMVVERRLDPETDQAPERRKLGEALQQRLREREAGCRRTLLQIYTHDRLEIEEAALGPVGGDLFDVRSWSRLGLGRGQLAATGAAVGAAVGGGIDFAVAGHSFMLGTVIGGALGAASSWLAWDSVAKVRVLGQSLGGVLLQAGPPRQPNFPWVALDRALLYHERVANRAHARRDRLTIESAEGREGPSSRLGLSERRTLQVLFDRLRKKRHDPLAVERTREELAKRIAPMLQDGLEESGG